MKSQRKLLWNDTFRIARIINSAKITVAEINDIISTKNILQTSADKETAQSEMGMKLIGYIAEKAPAAEKPLNEFLASMAGNKVADIEKSEITEIMELIKDIFENNKDIGDFFISALRSPKAIH